MKLRSPFNRNQPKNKSIDTNALSNQISFCLSRLKFGKNNPEEKPRVNCIGYREKRERREREREREGDDDPNELTMKVAVSYISAQSPPSLLPWLR